MVRFVWFEPHVRRSARERLAGCALPRHGYRAKDATDRGFYVYRSRPHRVTPWRWVSTWKLKKMTRRERLHKLRQAVVRKVGR